MTTWAHQTGKEPAPITYALDPIDMLIDEKNFGKTFMVKKTNIKTALRTYCEYLKDLEKVKSCAKLEEDNPLPTTAQLKVSPTHTATPKSEWLQLCHPEKPGSLACLSPGPPLSLPNAFGFFFCF